LLDVSCGANVEDESRLSGTGVGDGVDASARHGCAVARSQDPIFSPGPIPNRGGEDFDPFVLTEVQMTGHETAGFEMHIGAQ
jgi:hypothetical protein